MKKSILILNILLAIGVIVSDIFYILEGGLWLKSITSALFVLIGIVNLIYAVYTKSKHLKFSVTMLIGLIFAMAGDIVLNIHFIGGAILFALGHIIFFVAYSFINKFRWLDLILGTCLFIPSLLVLTVIPIFDFGGILMQIVCIIYALIICLMVGKAISNFIKERNITSLIILIGSILFFFSDLMLVLDMFSTAGAITGILCLATYYPAEILLAHSFFQINVKNKKNV